MTPRRRSLPWFVVFGCAAIALPVPAAETTRDEVPPLVTDAPPPSLGSRILEAILPTSLQKHPLIFFNAITEMTPEGRRRRQPTPEKPMYYFLKTGKFMQGGWQVAAGERPPPVAQLDAAMKKALAANGYLPIPDPDYRPELLILFSFGSHGTDPESTLPPSDSADPPPITAGELVPLVVGDLALFKDVIARASLVAGEKFALELKAALDEEVNNMRTNQTLGRGGSPIHLPVSPEFGSPFQIFISTGKNGGLVDHLAEMAFHTCYFVVASAYDYDAAESNEHVLLWRTKMTVEAQGVAMDEILSPLIANAGPYLGRDMAEAAVVRKRIDREGKVEIGTATVVPDAVPSTAPSQSDRH